LPSQAKGERKRERGSNFTPPKGEKEAVSTLYNTSLSLSLSLSHSPLSFSLSSLCPSIQTSG